MANDEGPEGGESTGAGSSSGEDLQTERPSMVLLGSMLLDVGVSQEYEGRQLSLTPTSGTRGGCFPPEESTRRGEAWSH